MLINKMIEEENQKTNGNEKQKIIEKIRIRESSSTENVNPNSKNENSYASFTLKDNDLERIQKRINDSMSDLVKGTLHILVEVKQAYLSNVNKEFIEDEEFQCV